MPTFRLFQHLLPRSRAWRIVIEKTLRDFFEGLAGFAAQVRTFIDLVYLDLFPADTRELPAWEEQFALSNSGSEATRRLRYAAAWADRGGQSPDYIQTQVQADGFTTVFIHEWWASSNPFVARDPRDFTENPLRGEYQDEATTPWQDFHEATAIHDTDTLANEIGYLVNLDLTRRAPPPVPDDPAFWPYFLYFGGETFGYPAVVDADRLEELKEKLLKHKPSQQWIVLMTTSVPVPEDLLLHFVADGTAGAVTLQAGTEDDLRILETVANPGTLGGTMTQSLAGERPFLSSPPDGRAVAFLPNTKIRSSLTASVWNFMHNAAGTCTIAMRVRLRGTNSMDLFWTQTTLVNPGILFEVNGTNLELYIATAGSATVVVAAGMTRNVTHTVVVVKNGTAIEIYIDDMVTPAGSGIVASTSASNPQSTLVLGDGFFDFDGWMPECMIYDTPADVTARQAIGAYLSRWRLEPTLAEYIAHMRNDGLAHLFTPDSIASIASWQDVITGTDMVLSGGTRTLETLDTVDALGLVGGAVGDFDAAAAIASGTNKGFTVAMFIELRDEGVGPALWSFTDNVGPDVHEWQMLNTSSTVIRNAEVSGINFGTDGTAREYVHTFKFAGSPHNFTRVKTFTDVPALADTDLVVDLFRIAAGAEVWFAWLALFDRAMNQPDQSLLYEMIARENVP